MQILENVPLAPMTSFQIGGPARFFVDVATEEDLVEVFRFAEAERLAVFLLGGGSNVLIPDTGFDGLVIRLALQGPVEQEGERFHAPAGADWEALVFLACRERMWGMECLAGIPGLVGASPIQNIGAYGQEASQTIRSVRAYDRFVGEFGTLSRDQCGFGYRTSIFNGVARGRYAITSVEFKLNSEGEANLSYPDLREYFADQPGVPNPLDVREAVRAVRHRKGMLLVAGEADSRSAGSFFKNPIVETSSLAVIADALAIQEERVPRYPVDDGRVKLPAAWLVERAGFAKGFVDGEAGISSRHTLALINRGGARYEDICRLRDRVAEAVRRRFGVTLEQEPVEPGA